MNQKLPYDAALGSGALNLIRMSPVQIDLDIVFAHLQAALTPHTRRLVFDDVMRLVRALGPRADDFLAALREHLYAAGVTSLFLQEIEPLSGFQIRLMETPISLMADNVLVIQQERALYALHRILAVLKMRYSTYNRTLRELVIDEEGIRVLRPDETVPGLLHVVAEAGDGRNPDGDTPFK